MLYWRSDSTDVVGPPWMATTSGRGLPGSWPGGNSSTPPTDVPSGKLLGKGLGPFQVTCLTWGNFHVFVCGFSEVRRWLFTNSSGSALEVLRNSATFAPPITVSNAETTTP